jgi:hypothetical protein
MPIGQAGGRHEQGVLVNDLLLAVVDVLLAAGTVP